MKESLSVVKQPFRGAPQPRRAFLQQSIAAGAAAVTLFHAPTILRAAEVSWGDLVGRFRYRGKAPARAKLTVNKDIDCCGKFDIRDERLMVGEDQGLQNVYVYVRTPKVAVHPELAAAAPPRVTLDNRHCIFMPHCMALWAAKQEFYIVNSDPVAQNVAFSPLGDTPANIVLPVGADAVYRFARKQLLPVPIACNYHPWESAYLLPRDNPYFAVAAADGAFRISQLPVGKLELQLWQELVGVLDAPRWPKGRLSVDIHPGTNDLGTIDVEPAWLSA